MRVLRLLLLGVLFVATAICFDLAWDAAQDLNETLVRQRWEHQRVRMGSARVLQVQRPALPRFDLAALETIRSADQTEPKRAERPPKQVRHRKVSSRAVAPVAAESVLVAPEDAIRMALRRKRAGLERCYNDELKKQAAFDGFIVVGLSLSADGRVTEAHLDQATRRDAQVGTCIVGLLRQLQLPPLSEEVDLIIPIRLEARPH